MSEATLDRLPVAQLPARYSISRTVLYERFAALKIEPERKGNKAYVNAEQIQLLDGLHQYLAQGGLTSDFLEQVGLSSSQSQSGKQSTSQLTKQEESLSLEALVEAIASKLSVPKTDPFANFRTLEEAYQHRWLLSTSHLATLLELSPKTFSRQASFSRYGFVFHKQGKNGYQAAWKVTKPERA